MRKLSELKQHQREHIRAKYILPENETDILVDDYGRPYQQTSTGKDFYSINKEFLYDSFHIHNKVRPN